MDIYKSTKRPEQRESEVKKHLPNGAVRLQDIHLGKSTRPFLDAVAERMRGDCATKDQFVVTILEGTYSNQQEKLRKLMSILGLIDPDKLITVMFDQESGEITITNNKDAVKVH